MRRARGGQNRPGSSTITGYEHLWMLKAHLDEEDGVLAELQKAG